MNPSNPSPRPGQPGRGEARQPAAPQAQRTPETDMQTEDAGTPASGTANRGSPAAPVMKQFAKTRHESTGRPD
jgi:hypothetical protein